MSRYRLFCLFTFAILIYGCSTNKPLISYDTSFQYHPNKTIFKYKTLAVNDSIKIIISLDNAALFSKISVETFRKNFLFGYAILPSINSKFALAKDSLHLNNLSIKKVNTTFLLFFDIPVIPDRNYATMLFFKDDVARNYIETDQIALDFTLKNSEKNFLLRNRYNDGYILNNFISPSDSIIIIPGSKDLSGVRISLLNRTFEPALPPHKENDSIDFNSIPVDTTYIVNTQSPLLLDHEGLCVINNGSKNIEGYTILVKNNKYPKIKSIEEMIGPLCYITNKSDFNKITHSKNPKATLDSFWLKIGNNKDYTRTLIKSYYERVEYANQVFTTYKEGWKTDRGMVYIVFGKPDEVYQYDDYEEWVYENVNSKMLTFTFLKTTEQFSAVDYQLKRNPNYQPYWYSAIEKWRNGIITK